MKAKNNKIKLNKVLQSLGNNPLNMDDIHNAEKRVWNNISYDIKKLEEGKNSFYKKKGLKVPKLKPFDQMSKKMSFNIAFAKLNGGNPTKSNMLGNILAAALSTMTITIFIASAAFFTLQRTGTIANSTNFTNIDQNTKNIASARFAALNNGVSYDDVQAVTADTGPIPDSPTPVTNQPVQTTTSSDNSTSTISDIDKAKIVANQTQNGKIYYYEQTYTLQNSDTAKNIINTHFGVTTGNLPDLDYTKPITFLNWYSINYSKIEVKQADKIVFMQVYTPSFAYEYQDGTYAILRSYVNFDNYISGYLGQDVKNPEINILKSILSNDPTFVKSGSIQIDGKNVLIFDKNTDGTIKYFDGFVYRNMKSSWNKIRYFVNQDDLTSVKTEYYDGTNLLANSKVSNSKELNVTDYNDVINYKETPTKDIREIPFNNSIIYPQYATASTFIQKYNIYYANYASKTEDIDLINNLHYPNEDYYLLKENLAFNPIGDFGEKIYYSQGFPGTERNLITEITTQDRVNSDLVTVDTKDIPVTVDKKPQTIKVLKQYSLTQYPNYDPKIQFSITNKVNTTDSNMIFNYSTQFKVGKYTYTLREYSSTTPRYLNDGLVLNSLSKDDASTFDSKSAVLLAAYPTLTDLDIVKTQSKINFNLSNNYKIKLNSAKQAAVADNSCEIYFSQIIPIECGVRKFAGSIWDYTLTNDKSVNYNVKYIELQGNINDTKNYFSQAQDYFTSKNLSISYKKIDDKTTAVIVYSSTLDLKNLGL